MPCSTWPRCRWTRTSSSSPSPRPRCRTSGEAEEVADQGEAEGRLKPLRTPRIDRLALGEPPDSAVSARVRMRAGGFMVAQVAEEVHYPDGRVGLASTDEIADSGYANGDLAPVPIERRTWTTYNYTALWIGMSHCIPTYLLASGLILVGMNWVQALVTIGLANLIVLVPMLLNSHAGTKYGIPYPVFARASFGLRGANLAAILRALVACAWFGIQTWIGGEGFYILIGAVAGNGWTHATPVIGGYPWTQWLSFALFWVLEMAIIVRGMETLRRFENWAAPVVLIAVI